MAKAIVEHDFANARARIQRGPAAGLATGAREVQCKTCGARSVTTLQARRCPFCDEPLVVELPPASLRGLRAAVTDRGVLLVAPTGIDVVPLGTLLAAQAPGILVPLGLEIVPRVSPDVLAAALDHGSGQWTVFTGDGPPFQIADSALAPLERRTIAKLDSERVEVRDVAIAGAGEPTVANDPLGRFALWGFPEPEQKTLASG